jgi:predicted XRE-type DNA-binding protein
MNAVIPELVSYVAVNIKSGCHEWQKCTLTTAFGGLPYGVLGWKGKTVRAHRLAYYLANNVPMGSIKGLFVRHKCDNPKCVNPSHLELGDAQSNVDDRESRSRSAKLSGEQQSNAKLTAAQAEEIRRMYIPKHPDYNQKALAAKFGVSRPRISMIVHGHSYPTTTE